MFSSQKITATNTASFASVTATMLTAAIMSFLLGSSVFLRQEQFALADDGAYCCGPGWKILGDIAFCDTNRPCCPGFEERVSMLPAVGLGLSCEREVGKRSATSAASSVGRYGVSSARDANNLSMLPWMRHTRSLADAGSSQVSNVIASQLTQPPIWKSAVAVGDSSPQPNKNTTKSSKQVENSSTKAALVAQALEKLLLSNNDVLEDALETGKQCRVVCN